MDIPDKIYLQIKDEDDEIPDEVTWCVDRIYDSDIVYLRGYVDQDGLASPFVYPRDKE